jgi:cell division protein FtsW (lipid II flippase)
VGWESADHASGKLPADHGPTFTAVTSLTCQQAIAVAHPVTLYVTRTEAGYAAYELLFGLPFLILAAIPLRRGEHWAWWCCWLLVPAFAAFGTLFGLHNFADLRLQSWLDSSSRWR